MNTVTPPVTQWFDGTDTEPVHVGTYESGPMRSHMMPFNGSFDREAYWDGQLWRWHKTGAACMHQARTWRGLADKPE